MLGIEARLVQLLDPYFGVRGNDALRLLQSRPLSLSRDDTIAIDDLVKPDKAQRVRTLFDQASRVPLTALPPAAQTVIVSVLFQYGSPTRVKKFWSYCTNQDWEMTLRELRDFKDKYPTRRNREADYLEAGLRFDSALEVPDTELDEDSVLSLAHTLDPPDMVLVAAAESAPEEALSC
jgi:hypothetical protein